MKWAPQLWSGWIKSQIGVTLSGLGCFEESNISKIARGLAPYLTKQKLDKTWSLSCTLEHISSQLAEEALIRRRVVKWRNNVARQNGPGREHHHEHVSIRQTWQQRSSSSNAQPKDKNGTSKLICKQLNTSKIMINTRTVCENCLYHP